MAVDWNQEEIERRIRIGAWRGVLTGAYAVQERGTELIQSPPKSGHIYQRRGVRHQASAPGEAPAGDSGRLAGSSDVFPDQANLSARVNWSAAYAKPLELGTQTMEPRPFARRSLAERKDFIEESVRSEIGKALK